MVSGSCKWLFSLSLNIDSQFSSASSSINLDFPSTTFLPCSGLSELILLLRIAKENAKYFNNRPKSTDTASKINILINYNFPSSLLISYTRDFEYQMRSYCFLYYVISGHYVTLIWTAVQIKISTESFIPNATYLYR